MMCCGCVVHRQRDNISVQEDDRVRVFTDETGHVKLVIRNVTHADAGLYFCIADNRVAKAKCAATLRVVGTPLIAYAMMASFFYLTNASCKAGLVCSHQSKPASLSPYGSM
jgi:hypothetical protein